MNREKAALSTHQRFGGEASATRRGGFRQKFGNDGDVPEKAGCRNENR